MCPPGWYHFGQGLFSSTCRLFPAMGCRTAVFLALCSPSKCCETCFLLRHLQVAPRFSKVQIHHTESILHQVTRTVSFYCNEHKNLLPWEVRGRIPTSFCAPAPLNNLGASQLFHSWLADGKRWEQTGCCSGFLWQSSRIALSSS